MSLFADLTGDATMAFLFISGMLALTARGLFGSNWASKAGDALKDQAKEKGFSWLIGKWK
jgi:hypothetical protein